MEEQEKKIIITGYKAVLFGKICKRHNGYFETENPTETVCIKCRQRDGDTINDQ